VCWRRKHISFPFLPLPRTTELRFQLITCSNRDRSNKCRRFSVVVNRDNQSAGVSLNVAGVKSSGWEVGTTGNVGPLNTGTAPRLLRYERY
jgi:hypothetical protein